MKFLKNNGKKVVALVCALLLMICAFAGCSEASKVNYNTAKQARYFDCERRITVYNAITDKAILEIEGYMDISNDTEDELVVTCKVGNGEYKMNYVYLNKNFTMYTVEDISGTHTDPYHYKFYIHTENLPSVDMKP